MKFLKAIFKGDPVKEVSKATQVLSITRRKRHQVKIYIIIIIAILTILGVCVPGSRDFIVQILEMMPK